MSNYFFSQALSQKLNAIKKFQEILKFINNATYAAPFPETKFKGINQLFTSVVIFHMKAFKF